MRHLDTNIVIAHLNGNQKVSHLIQNHLPDIGISVLVQAELLFGARNSGRPERNLRNLMEFLNLIEVFPFDEFCADIYSRLRVELNGKGRPLPTMDLLIASVAVMHNAILVTQDINDFTPVKDLQIEDWLT